MGHERFCRLQNMLLQDPDALLHRALSSGFVSEIPRQGGLRTCFPLSSVKLINFSLACPETLEANVASLGTGLGPNPLTKSFEVLNEAFFFICGTNKPTVAPLSNLSVKRALTSVSPVGRRNCISVQPSSHVRWVELANRAPLWGFNGYVPCI